MHSFLKDIITLNSRLEDAMQLGQPMYVRTQKPTKREINLKWAGIVLSLLIGLACVCFTCKTIFG